VPFRTRHGDRRRALTLYILIEHQSDPDPLMILRVLEYLVQVYKGQMRAWQGRHRSLAGFRLQPVLPVVLYTGTRRWDDLGRLLDLVDGGAAFAEVVPELRPLFVSLPALPAERLETEGGYFGWLLEAVQQRFAPSEPFEALVAHVLSHLEEMPAAERDRWLELLSYLVAMIYHDRAVPEREGLRERVVASVRTDPRRQEVATVSQTIAEALREEGRLQGQKEGAVEALQQTLLRQLRLRFHKVPRAVEKVIRATDDIGRLQSWCDRFASAQTIEDLGIVPERER
jgi:hypothetical protein